MRVIHLCRKPVEGSVAKNALKYGTGGLNIDGTRLALTAECEEGQVQRQQTSAGSIEGAFGAARLIGKEIPTYKPGGRWPANVILQHLPGCRLAGTAASKPYTINRFTDGAKPFGGGAGHDYETVDTGPDVSEVWDCAEGCPVKDLDEQSGILRPRGNINPSRSGGGTGVSVTPGPPFTSNHHARPELKAEGGASRFFKQVQAEPEFVRAGVDCLCPACNKPYIKHPYDMKKLDWDGNPWLNVLCNGTRVKL